MSDWRSRARPVTTAGGGGWRSRARPVDPEAPAMPKVGEWETGMRTYGEAVTFGHGDEVGGAVQANLAELANQFPRLAEALGIDSRYKHDVQGVYREAKAENRLLREEGAKHNPKAAAVGTGLGIVNSALALPGGAGWAGAAKAGAAYGALSGAGNSEADLLDKGEFGTLALDAVLGGAAGAAGGVAGKALGVGVGKLGEAVGRTRVGGLSKKVAEWAEKKLEAAKVKAGGMAQTEKLDEVAKLEGSAGGLTQRASRITENIRRVPGDEVAASGADLVRTKTAAAAAARQKAATLRLEADAAGLAEGVADRGGEFLSKGSKLAKAQSARGLVEFYEQAAERLEREAAEAAAGTLKGVNTGLAGERAAAIASPEFAATENFVLRHNIRDLPTAVPKAEAAWRAAHEARDALPENIAKRAEEILSPGEALNQVKMRAQRYLPPVVGDLVGRAGFSPLGGVIGGATGVALGQDWQSASIGAFAGSALRPAGHALRKMFQHPSVQAAVFGAVKRLAQTSPDSLGPFGKVLQQAAAKGDRAFAVTAYTLSARSPEFADKVMSLVEAESPGAPGLASQPGTGPSASPTGRSRPPTR